ncbi:MAG: hypothetical protein ACREO3_01310 [Arenimonas sp.]
MTPLDTGKARIWYVVAPMSGGWQVTFGVAGSPFRYATRAEAETVARGAAKLHWENRREPAGARLDRVDGSRVVLGTYGRQAASAPLQATR